MFYFDVGFFGGGVWFVICDAHWQNITDDKYKGYNESKLILTTVKHSRLQYGNKERGNPGEAVCIWGFQYVCVNTERNTTQVVRVGWGGHTHTDTHCCQHFFCLLVWRRFRSAVPLQAQLWSLSLFREHISFTLWCLFVYKKANPTLKIARLVWKSGRMKQTLSGTQMLVKTTFIFHSGHVTVLLFFHTDAQTVCWTPTPTSEERSGSERFHFDACFLLTSNQQYCFNKDCIVWGMQTGFIFSQSCSVSIVRLY